VCFSSLPEKRNQFCTGLPNADLSVKSPLPNGCKEINLYDNMCGIVGYLGTAETEEAVEAVLAGLDLLQNRGYDSVGLSIIESDKIRTIKCASTTINNALPVLKNRLTPLPLSNVARGHTRWATHGGKTDANAHPHHDEKDRLSLVHNGIIENFAEIKADLVKKGYSFKSSTDTEVISVLIGALLDEGRTMLEAIQEATARFKGTWALVLLQRDFPTKMWAVRNGSPLLMGSSPSCIMLASEQVAFQSYINQYIVLKDHDVLEIENRDNEFVFNKSLAKYRREQTKSEEVVATPAPWSHWMLKEIMEQPAAVLRAMNNGGRIASETTVKLGGLDACRPLLENIDHLVLLGCGTSFHAGLWSIALFKSLEAFDTVTLYDGADFCERDIPRRGRTAAILLSQSGETKDLQRCIQVLQERGVIRIGVVNAVDSFIARETNCGVYLNAGREVAVASTKSFTNQCVVLALIAVWFSQIKGTHEENRRKILADLQQLSIQLASAITPENRAALSQSAREIARAPSLFLLGKGKEEAIAKEGALKLKEIAHIHAEGYSTAALKHGPFGLLEPHMPVLILDIGDEIRDKTANARAEVAARDAHIINLSDNTERSVCAIEPNRTFGGLIANVCLQVIAYECAVFQGKSPDYPRNLAKVVTVE
jgi:glucosamine--fructose-6-phosphate aminotransferase (isomerizing)